MTEDKKHTPKDGPLLKNGGREARKVSALILSVLTGEMRPLDAATVLGVGLPRYYQIERQALEGFLAACEPREKGRREKSADKKMAEMEMEKRRIERDLQRTQSLLRAMQKTGGIAMPVPKKPVPGARKRRKPEVRALKIARSLAKPAQSFSEDSPKAVSEATAPLN